MLKKSLIGILAIGAMAVPALAHHDGELFAVGDLKVSHAWTEEVGATSHAIEVYLTITNQGEEADRLVAVESEFTQPGIFQAPVLGEDGTLKVREVEQIEIGAGQQITFQPGGLHIVLNDVKQSLMAGDHFHLDLTFAKAGEVEIEVEVEEPHAHGDAES
jgi:copper(I)-binding protein